MKARLEPVALPLVPSAGAGCDPTSDPTNDGL